MDKRLTQFLAVAESGSLSRAAEALGVSQPTISVNLRRLEDEHGVTLFERSSRGVVLTEFGQILHDHVRAMKRLDLHARAEIRARRSNREHGLRIGCGYAWWQFPLRDVIDGFRRDNPERSVLVDVSSSLDGLRKILSGDIALFLGTEVEALKPELAVDFTPLFKAKHAFFAREDHPLAGRSCSRSDINQYEGLDVVPIETSHFAIVDPMRDSTNDQRKISAAVLSSNSMTVCIDFLSRSNATLGYPRALEAYLAGHGIFPLDVAEEDTWETVGIYRLREKRHTRALRSFLTQIERSLEHPAAADLHLDLLAGNRVGEGRTD